jgi:hypothetical protein
MRSLKAGLFGGALVSACAFATILTQPARSVEIVHADLAEVAEQPTAHGFRIHDMWWDLGEYQKDQHLAPFRTFFTEHCAHRKGIAASNCVAKVLVDHFPHGIPKSDSFARDYDPVADFEQHMGGQPGDCVTRSTLLVTILLSNGIPAREVQFLSDEESHTATEVWDNGWVFFDPTFADVFRDANVVMSASDALVRGHGAAETMGTAAQTRAFYSSRGDHVTLRYPEPWLLTRLGTSTATWPLRSHVVEVGARSWAHGSWQPFLRGIVVASGLVSVLCALLLVRRKRPKEPAQITLGSPALDR